MSFGEIATLLGLIGGAVYGTFQICYILFRKSEKR